jgi:LmbE family N-acetylglucosaminyl deacetylase
MPGALDPSRLGDRVLIVAAHPDDEVLVAGGSIRALRSRGAGVRVVLLTAGDGYLRAARRLGGPFPTAEAYLRLGAMRFRESVDAAAVLGMDAHDVICLGYPDGRLSAMLDPGSAPPRAAAGRSGSAVVPYEWAYRPGAPCTGEGLGADLAAIVGEYRPTAVIHPDARDAHGDHAAAAAFVDDALSASGVDGMRLTCLVHFGHYPYPWAYRPSDAIRPPRALRGAGFDWVSVALEPAEVAAKEAALRAFPSQNAIPDLRWFMRAFVRTNELFLMRDGAARAG